MSNRAIAHRLGVTENAVRKQVGPSKPPEIAQRPLPAIPTASDNLGTMSVPSSTSTKKTGR